MKMKAMHLSTHERTMTALMTPDMANCAGNVHGGTMLKFLDPVTYAYTSRYGGELVTFLASVNDMGKSSMEIGIKVIAENIQTEELRHANSFRLVGCPPAVARPR